MSLENRFSMYLAQEAAKADVMLRMTADGVGDMEGQLAWLQANATPEEKADAMERLVRALGNAVVGLAQAIDELGNHVGLEWPDEAPD